MCSKRSVLYVFLLTALVGLSSWGFLVHRTIHQIAVYQLPEPMRSFFYTDMDNLVFNVLDYKKITKNSLIKESSLLKKFLVE